MNLDQLQDRAVYCVIRDEANRESIVALGSEIKSRASSNPDFRRFKKGELMTLPGYVRVHVNATYYLGIWLDPTRPELQDGESEWPETTRVAVVNATPKKRSMLDTLTSCTYLTDLCS